MSADSIPVTSLDQVKSIIAELRSENFKALDSAEIRFREFDDAGYFFQCNFNLHDVLSKKHRVYTLLYNPALFKLNLISRAVKGILAHELSHAADYQSHSGAQLIGVLFKLSCRKSKIRFERRTDIRAIAFGYATGLAEFRTGIYPSLTPKQLRLKKIFYYSPEQIKSIDDRLKAHEALYGSNERVLQQLLKNPPK